MQYNNITIDFDSSIDTKAELEKAVFEAYRKNKEFFGKDITNLKVNFLYRREQFDEINGEKTSEWEVGHAYTKDNLEQVAIFSPSVFDKVSNHLASDFPYTLAHEVTHVFTQQILGFYYPKWLHEGVAGYVAEQYKIRTVKRVDNFDELHDFKSWMKIHNYPQAFIFTKYLFDTLEKEKLIEFMTELPKKLGKHHFPEDFKKFFKEFFGVDFEEISSNWKETLNLT